MPYLLQIIPFSLQFSLPLFIANLLVILREISNKCILPNTFFFEILHTGYILVYLRFIEWNNMCLWIYKCLFTPCSPSAPSLKNCRVVLNQEPRHTLQKVTPHKIWQIFFRLMGKNLYMIKKQSTFLTHAHFDL